MDTLTSPLPSKRSTRRSKILSLLSQHPDGLAPEDIALLLETDVKKIRPRLTELKKAGKIRETGAKKKFGPRSSKLVSLA